MRSHQEGPNIYLGPTKRGPVFFNLTPNACFVNTRSPRGALLRYPLEPSWAASSMSYSSLLVHATAQLYYSALLLACTALYDSTLPWTTNRVRTQVLDDANMAPGSSRKAEYGQTEERERHELRYPCSQIKALRDSAARASAVNSRSKPAMSNMLIDPRDQLVGAHLHRVGRQEGARAAPS